MVKPRDGSRQTWMTAAICLTVLSGIIVWPPIVNVLGQEAVKPKTPPATVLQADLVGDLDKAIQLIEKNDYRTFIEQYGPVEILRKLRQQDLVDRAAALMASQPKTKTQLLTMLKALKGQSPKFDKSGGMATLEFDTSAGGTDEVPGELNIPDTLGLKLTGLGSDLNRVFADAAKLLEAGDITAFADRVFPASELARLQAADARQAMLQQFKETPELAQSMIADFKSLQTAKPTLTDNGNVASFSMASSKRTIKFQKVDANWRLFDDSPRVVTELTRQAKLKPGSAIRIVQMERIGGNWRFIELPVLRAD